MKKTDTLKKNYEFSLVYRKGEYFVGKYMTLYVLPTKNDIKRLGITVSKKSFKKSIERNRIRRIVKENYRLWEKEIDQTVDMVFVLRKGNSLPSYQEIHREMKYLLSLSGLLKNEEESQK